MIAPASAGFARRAAALVYDALLLLALLMVYTALTLAVMPGHHAITRQSSAAGWYLYRTGEVAVIGAYYVVNWLRSGQTLGMRAWQLHAVDPAGNRLRSRAAVLRFAFGVLAWPPAGLGVLWLYLDPDGLAIHDRLSRTRVIRRRPAQRPATHR